MSSTSGCLALGDRGLPGGVFCRRCVRARGNVSTALVAGYAGRTGGWRDGGSRNGEHRQRCGDGQLRGLGTLVGLQSRALPTAASGHCRPPGDRHHRPRGGHRSGRSTDGGPPHEHPAGSGTSDQRGCTRHRGLGGACARALRPTGRSQSAAPSRGTRALASTASGAGHGDPCTRRARGSGFLRCAPRNLGGHGARSDTARNRQRSGRCTTGTGGVGTRLPRCRRNGEVAGIRRRLAGDLTGSGRRLCARTRSIAAPRSDGRRTTGPPAR